MKFLLAKLVVSIFGAAPLAWGYPELKQKEGGKAPCPFRSRQTEEALAKANMEAAPRIAAWEGWETSEDASAEEPLVERMYEVGVKNDGEEFCSGDDDNKFCNKVNGPWGDSIPQNGTYCIWAMLEFQDELEFNYGGNNTNFSTFLGAYQGTLESLPQGNGEVLMYGGSLGVPAGQPHAVPWPTASIIWADGNKHAKPWIENVHRPYQSSGYSMGFTAHTHFKAVKCDEINTVLTNNGLFNESMTSTYWIAEGAVISGTSGFRRYWNAFAEIEDHSSIFYPQAGTCALGPCPSDTEEPNATTPDVGPEGADPADKTDSSSSAIHAYYPVVSVVVAISMVLVL